MNEAGLLVISRGTALVLLFVYCSYIFFQVRLFLNYRCWPLIALIHLAENPCRTLCPRYPWVWGGGRRRGAEDECCCGCLLVSQNELVLLRPLRSFQSIGCHCRHLILCWLLQVSLLFFLLKRVLIPCLLLSVVGSIEEFAERYSVPKSFIGMILLPIVVSEMPNLVFLLS